MSVEDPNGIVGKRESHVLEFKAKEILKSPTKIAREVVAFLNKEGGDVWIGYPEQNGVALAPETIPDADRALGALQNHLIDTIEPPVRIPGDVDLKVVNGQILVSVSKGKNFPYAHRDKGRHYWIRGGDRVRDMSREEIFQSKSEDPVLKVVDVLREAQKEATKGFPSSLWLRLVPSESLSIDVDDQATTEMFRKWLTDPTATGNRRGGWSFAHDLTPPKTLGDTIQHGEASYRTEIKNTGQVTFTMDRNLLYWMGNDSDPRDLWPNTLIGLPTSLFHLMAAMLGQYGKERSDLKVVAGFFINGIRDWRLRPGSAREPVLPWAGPKTLEEDVLEIDPERLVFDADKLRENPDQCGLRLVRLIYGAFGFESDAIPPEFDQQHGVLRLG